MGAQSRGGAAAHAKSNATSEIFILARLVTELMASTILASHMWFMCCSFGLHMVHYENFGVDSRRGEGVHICFVDGTFLQGFKPSRHHMKRIDLDTGVLMGDIKSLVTELIGLFAVAVLEPWDNFDPLLSAPCVMVYCTLRI